ncbi:MAG: phage baseplate upper protein [Oscillospiraceae bacterium]|jgi:hypothetical protein|nr:phage baseplate upper protein [Oscillospiraceae bacterium]
MATPIRTTHITVDTYTQRISCTPQGPIPLFAGDKHANRLVFSLQNDGAPVDALGYAAMLCYTRPDGTDVLDALHPDEAGTLSAIVPGAVYTQEGTVRCSLTLTDAQTVSTQFSITLAVRRKAGTEPGGGVDAGNTLPTYAQVVQLVRELELALALADPDNLDYPTIAQRLTGLEGFAGRAPGFATATQGVLAEAALPAAAYTAQDVYDKVISLSGAGGGLNADTLGGNPPEVFATAVQLAALAQAVPEKLTLSVALPAEAWVNTGERWVQTAALPEALPSGYLYTVGATPQSMLVYGSAGVYAGDIAVAGQMAFYARELPEEALNVYIVRESMTAA